jgi:dephospho-CoA kinase
LTPNIKPTALKEGFRPALAGASIVLLTGPSGSGKSTLAQALEERAWERLDGDALARSLYVPGSALMKDLQRVFGKSVVKADGHLDRVRLGEIVFPSLAQRKRLNALVYPRFLRALKTAVKSARREQRALVADVAVYFDAGAPDLGVPVVLVDAPLVLRVKRLQQRGLDAPRARAQAQALNFGAAARKQAAAVLDGRQPKAALRRQLLKLLQPVEA